MSVTKDYQTFEEVKEGGKFNLSKYDHDLFHDEDYIPQKIIRVKMCSMPNKGEKWKVFENDEVLFVIDGSKINQKEKAFIQTVEGVTFIIAKVKSGLRTWSEIKSEIKKK